MELVWPLAIFVATFIIGWAVRRLILKALRAWTSRTGSRAGLVLAEALSGPILIWAAILALHVGLQSSTLPGRFTDWGAKTLFVLWIVSLTIDVHADRPRLDSLLWQPDPRRSAGGHPYPEPRPDCGSDSGGAGAARSLPRFDHAHADGLGRGRPGGGTGAARHALQSVRRLLCRGGRAGQAGGLHQAEHRRGGIRHRHRLAQHHHPEPREQT